MHVSCVLTMAVCGMSLPLMRRLLEGVKWATTPYSGLTRWLGPWLLHSRRASQFADLLLECCRSEGISTLAGCTAQRLAAHVELLLLQASALEPLSPCSLPVDKPSKGTRCAMVWRQQTPNHLQGRGDTRPHRLPQDCYAAGRGLHFRTACLPSLAGVSLASETCGALAEPGSEYPMLYLHRESCPQICGVLVQVEVVRLQAVLHLQSSTSRKSPALLCRPCQVSPAMALLHSGHIHCRCSLTSWTCGPTAQPSSG